MADWRKVEAELIHNFEAAGVGIIRYSGDAYAVMLSIEDCGRPHLCEAVINLKGEIECANCDISERANSKWASIHVTDLAKRLANDG